MTRACPVPFLMPHRPPPTSLPNTSGHAHLLISIPSSVFTRPVLLSIRTRSMGLMKSPTNSTSSRSFLASLAAGALTLVRGFARNTRNPITDTRRLDGTLPSMKSSRWCGAAARQHNLSLVASQMRTFRCLTRIWHASWARPLAGLCQVVPLHLHPHGLAPHFLSNRRLKRAWRQ